MKAIIPVAGVGSRLRPHTHTQPKALVPVAGKAILAHIIDDLVASGVEDFVLVVGYLADKIESFVQKHYQHLRIELVMQEPRRGIAHALWMAKAQIEQEENVLIVLGDSIVTLDLAELLAAPGSVVGVKKVDVPGQFGVAETNGDGIIRRLIEKPRIPKSNLALVGIYKIHQPTRLLAAIAYIMEHDIRSMGEFHLTDALMYMIEQGEVIRTASVRNWFDCGRKETLLEANAILLSRAPRTGVLSAEQAAHLFPGTIIVPPVSIGEHCRIENSIIGPNVAIGDFSEIRHSIIRDTIVGSYSELHRAVLDHSIIGNDTSLKGLSQSLNIGDDTEIDFNPQ